MSKTLFTTILLIAAFPLLGCTSQPPIAATPSLGEQPVAVVDIDAQFGTALQALLDDWRDSHNIVGVTMALSIAGRESWAGASGLSDRDAATVMMPDDGFRIGSITMTFVSVVALQLAQEGILQLDQALADFVPDFPNAENITLRQLLNHTSGIFNYVDGTFIEELVSDTHKMWRPDELVAVAAARVPLFEPGSGWSYSNTNYILVSMVVEAATGSPFLNELNQRVIVPLELTQTRLATGEDMQSDLVHGYSNVGSDGTNDDVTNMSYTALETAAGAAGAMVSNTEDLVRFVTALFAEQQLLDDAQREQMLNFVSTGGSDTLMLYGLGIYQTQSAAGVTWFHSGGVPGFSAVMAYAPEQDAALAILVNMDTSSDALLALMDTAFEIVAQD